MNKIIHKIILSTISKSSKKKCKRNPSGFDLFYFNLSMSAFCFVNKIGRLAHPGIIFEPVRKSVRNGKKTSACLKNVLRNYELSWNLTFRKTKSDFEIQLCTNFFKAITDSSCSCSENIHMCFVFILGKFFLRVYLAKQHNYFENRKLYRNSLIIEN